MSVEQHHEAFEALRVALESYADRAKVPFDVAMCLLANGALVVVRAGDSIVGLEPCRTH
jgi:hypothetical protein